MKLSVHNQISNEQYNTAREYFKDQFYSPNIFIRAGLFFFTLILANAALGIVGSILFTIFSDDLFFGFILIIGAAVLILALEYFIKTKNHFRSGMDDCLLYMAVVFVISGMVLMFEISSGLIITMICLPVLIAGTLRYADSLLALLAFLDLYVIIFLMVEKTVLGTNFLPFIYFGISTALCVVFYKLLKQEQFYFYFRSLKLLKIAALLCIYLSVNYFVVKEGNALLNDNASYVEMPEGYNELQQQIDSNNSILNNHYSNENEQINQSEIIRLENENNRLYAQIDSLITARNSRSVMTGLPFGFYFLLLTFLIPVLYLWLGLKWKDRILLNCGLLILCLTTLTYQYYYHPVSIEYLMTFAGLLMILFSWYSIKYLKRNAGRFTFREEPPTGSNEHRNIEALATVQVMGQTATDTEEGFKFGDGKFGGGGSGSGF